jgi:nucleotide-binding universal stress UspA family protein
LGAEVTLMSVISEHGDGAEIRQRTERFLAAGARTLTLLGLTTHTLVRTMSSGHSVRDEIVAEMTTGQHDLLVLGAPLSARDGRAALAGIVGQILSNATNYPVLIVRSRYATTNAPWIAANGRINLAEEVIR